MKVMVFVKATKDSEEGKLPGRELIEAMGRFNEELANAGILVTCDGLKPTSAAARVHFSGKERTVSKGPFKDGEGTVAGFWIWEVTSMEEAIAWVKRCPNPMLGDSDIDIRPFYELSDFGDLATPEMIEQEEQIRKKTAGKR
ncbi:MAG: YciI family protein [Rickettsiales bacterium]